MQSPLRSLEGMKVAVSLSESDDAADLGYRAENVNRLLVRLAEMLLGEGACLVLGHNWRRDGVMEAIHRAAIQYRGDTPPIINLLPWPDTPGMNKAERFEAGQTIQIISVGLPDGLQPFGVVGPEGAQAAWLRARALTHMRRRLTTEAHAMIGLGGRTSGFGGRYPGVVEEVFLMTCAEKPAYLFDLLGGATADIIRVIRGDAGAEDALARIASSTPKAKEAFNCYPDKDPDAIIDVDEVRRHFTETLSLEKLAGHSGLTQKEYDDLSRSTGFQQVLAGVLRGLREVWKTPRPS